MGRMVKWWPLCWRSTCDALEVEVAALRPKAEAWDGLCRATTVTMREQAANHSIAGVLQERPESNVFEFKRKRKGEGS